MRRIFSHPVLALAAGLCLRLFFVLKFPGESGDTALYEEIAKNWLKEHIYATGVHGALTPGDLRMPGYPAFLALVYAITGHTGESARLFVMLGQIAVDIAGCGFVAWLAGWLLAERNRQTQQAPVLRAAWWLAMLCPFTANYTAVVLTETFAVALTAAALVFLTGLCASAGQVIVPKPQEPWAWSNNYRQWAILGGLTVGIATLFRPESPLLLIAALLATALQLLRRGRIGVWLRIAAYSSIAFILPLLPWAARNFVTFHEVQLLTPKYSTVPGELVPYGFMAWERTWLYSMRDCYAVPWKLNDEEIKVEEIPARAFDSPEEERRVSTILEQYNADLTLTKKEDSAFGQIAQERNARHPMRTYLWVPLARVVAIWFTPRIELLPISGNVFPIAKMHEVDPEDQEFTILLFFINLFYLGIGAWGALRLWHSSAVVRPLVAFLILFLLIRTAFLITLETPEPRYVLVCFPVVIALGAQLFAQKTQVQAAS